ncbi:MAG: hypothetical protein HQL32_09275 [Planctomycetes bacterium]|nr:hypothetical protein [Planctomycetota bacterium]
MPDTQQDETLNASKKGFQWEGFLMGATISLIVAGGLYFLFTSNHNQPSTSSEGVKNAKRYNEGSLHHVADDLIKYEAINSFSTHVGGVWALAVNPKGSIFVCGKKGIAQYSNSGGLVKKFTEGEAVRSLSISPKGDLVACLDTEVRLYNSNAKVEEKWQNPDWGKLTSAIITTEFLFVADRNNRAIWKCALNDGHTIKSIGTPETDKANSLVMPGPYMKIALDSQGQIIANNPGRHQVNIYSLDGNLKSVFGFPSFKHTGFCGCCNPMALATLKSGQVITAEKGIARVKLLSTTGELEGIVAAPKDFGKNKHAFAIDLVEGPDGKIYILDNISQEVRIYQKKEKDHV